MVESALTVMSGKVGALPDLQASFTTIWTPVDTHADAYLLMLLGDVVYHQVLPALKRPNILPLMQEYTAKRFFNVGYELRPEEIDGIARYFTYLLECAAPGEKQLIDEDARATTCEFTSTQMAQCAKTCTRCACPIGCASWRGWPFRMRA